MSEDHIVAEAHRTREKLAAHARLFKSALTEGAPSWAKLAGDYTEG